MNPKYHLLVAAAALSLGACSTDDTCTDPEPQKGYKISFTVEENPESRTVLDVGDNLRWMPTDKVGIYTVGQNVNPNTLTVADVNQSPVEFIGVLKKIVSPGDMFYAYYPYNAAQSADPAAVRLSIPVEQKQTKAGVYNGQSHPLVAVPMAFPWDRDSYACRMSSVRFRQLGAIVELQLYSSNEALRSETINSVTFVSDTPLAGDFQFDLTAVKIDGEMPISGYNSTEVTTLLEEPAAIPAADGEAARIYLTIAPGQYTTGQIVVKTDAARYTFSLAEAMTFERAVIKGLPADLAGAERKVPSPDDPVSEDDPINFEDPVVKEICLEHWDTNGDYQLSYKEAAAVTSIGSEFQIDQKKLIRSFNELRYFTGLQTIGSVAFSGCSNLTSINIPEGVTAIGYSTFYGCSNLTNINIPDGVTEIEGGTFDGCSSLTSINIPDGVTTIRSKAFYQCGSLSSINIPDGVTEIGYSAFDGCSSLTSINLPNKLTTIGEGAFSGCSSLTSIIIPEGVTTIGRSVFQDCSSLTSIHIPEGVTTIGGNAFDGCNSLMSINIPEGVTGIGGFAFRGCSNLTSINIPDGVTKIEQYTFDGCSSLTSINIPKTVSSIGERAFLECSSLSAFSGKYASADHRCLIQYGALLAFAPAGLTEYTIPDGVIAIGDYAFYKCSNLTSINISGGVTTIEKEAFNSCSSLTSINMSDGVTAIEEYAFRDCSSLTSVYCQSTTPPTLGYNAFYCTPSSMKIYVPVALVEAYKTNWSWYASRIFADNN